MTSDTGMYEIWEVDVTGRPLFCHDRRLTLPDANGRLREMLEEGLVFGGRLEVRFPSDRTGGG